MPEYQILNKDNNPNRKSRLEKELQTYREYLALIMERSNKVLFGLQQRAKAKKSATENEQI